MSSTGRDSSPLPVNITGAGIGGDGDGDDAYIADETSSPISPSKFDVLLGRATTVYNHPGNRRYRQIIANNLSSYKQASTRLDKMVLIRQVTEQILENGHVKFLKKDARLGNWSQIPFRVALDKVSHALRDGINKQLHPVVRRTSMPTTHLDMDVLSSRLIPTTRTTAATQSSTALHRTLSNQSTVPLAAPAAAVPTFPIHQNVTTDFLKARLLQNSAQLLNSASMMAFTQQQQQRRSIHSPIVRLENMAVATATSRAALARLNTLSRMTTIQPPLPPPETTPSMIWQQRHPPLSRVQNFPLESSHHQLQNRFLPPLIAAPKMRRGLGTISTPSFDNDLSLEAAETLYAAAYRNSSLTTSPQPQKIVFHPESTPPTKTSALAMPLFGGRTAIHHESQLRLLEPDSKNEVARESMLPPPQQEQFLNRKGKEEKKVSPTTQNFIHNVVQKYTENALLTDTRKHQFPAAVKPKSKRRRRHHRCPDEKDNGDDDVDK